MPYCQRCGRACNNEESFCPDCGASLGGGTPPAQNNNSTRAVYTERNAGIALLLSLLIPGIGSVYVGKVAKGIGLLLLNMVSWIIGMFAAAAIAASMGATEDLTDAAAASGGFGIIIAFIGIPFLVWIYTLYAAYKDAARYNEYLAETGQPPW